MTRHGAAGYHYRRTAAGRDAATDWLHAVTGPAALPRAATNNFKFLFMFLATTVAAVWVRALCARVLRNLIDMSYKLNVNQVFTVWI